MSHPLPSFITVATAALLAMCALSRGASAQNLGTPFCIPGQQGVRTCPCSNPESTLSRGCNNFGQHTGGAQLTATGSAMVNADTVVLTSSFENNTAATIIMQGTTVLPSGVTFGAGIRCVAGALERIYLGGAGSAANGDPLGVFHRPGPANTNSVSFQSANTPPYYYDISVHAPVTLYYMAYYHDGNAALACGNPSSNFNSTQGLAILWQ